jgi:arsenate reductase-like glutaredoxin family protein
LTAAAGHGGSRIAFWGRAGSEATLSAQRFLRQHGYGADRVLDLDRAPPGPGELAAIAKGLGGTLRPLVAPGLDAPEEAGLADWLLADPRRMRDPVLLTPRGAVAGFRERAWSAFLDIGKGRS